MAMTLRKKTYTDNGQGLTVGIANIIPEKGSLSANRDRMLKSLDVFAGQGVNLAIFPEYGLSGAFWEDRTACLDYMAGACLDRQIPWLETRVLPYIGPDLEYIVVNGPVSDGRGWFYNTTLVMDRSGAALAPDRTYRKTFLPGSEKRHIRPDPEDILVMDTHYGRMGFLTCYDICFPQPLTRLVFECEIDILVVPAAWRRQGDRTYPGMNIREKHFYQRQWEMLVPALATQYQIWVMAANGVGPRSIPGTDYCGRSGIWAPSGINMILGSDREEELLVLGNIDIRGALDMERADFGCVKDYRAIRKF